jgi:uncharacterized metal-binding protein YceD (DUF177 family)
MKEGVQAAPNCRSRLNMAFDIRDLTATPGHRFAVDLRLIPPAELFAQDDWTVTEIHVIGEAFAQLSTLYMEVELHATITQLCRRCLSPVVVTVVVSEPFELPIPPNSDLVDPLPIALQMVQAVHDPHVVCGRTCRGLCSRCGTNLNNHPDHVCPESDSDKATLRDYLS